MYKVFEGYFDRVYSNGWIVATRYNRWIAIPDTITARPTSQEFQYFKKQFLQQLQETYFLIEQKESDWRYCEILNWYFKNTPPDNSFPFEMGRYHWEKKRERKLKFILKRTECPYYYENLYIYTDGQNVQAYVVTKDGLVYEPIEKVFFIPNAFDGIGDDKRGILQVSNHEFNMENRIKYTELELKKIQAPKIPMKELIMQMQHQDFEKVGNKYIETRVLKFQLKPSLENLEIAKDIYANMFAVPIGEIEDLEKFFCNYVSSRIKFQWFERKSKGLRVEKYKWGTMYYPINKEDK